MIVVNGLAKRYGSRTLWEELSVEFQPGTLTALTGPSGSGKSTLLNCIGALDKPDEGSVDVHGERVTDFGHKAARLYRRDTVGYLFQDYALVSDRSVDYNVGLAVVGWRRRKATDVVVAEALARVGLEGYGPRAVHELSGGEQQRVSIARLLVRNPKVVLADEPTGALDEGNSLMVIDHLRSMAANGATVIIATHEPLVVDNVDAVVRIGVTP